VPLAERPPPQADACNATDSETTTNRRSGLMRDVSLPGRVATARLGMLERVDDVVTQIREACEQVASRARHVRIELEAIPGYAESLPLGALSASPDSQTHLTQGTPEELAAFWLTLDAINFGSGWFPTLRKRAGCSGYHTIAAGVRGRFEADGPWSAEQLANIESPEIAAVLAQDPDHELMTLFAGSLQDLGRRVQDEYHGAFAAVARAASGSAVALVTTLAGWPCFDDVSVYDGLPVPFLKRAQIAASDLAGAGVAELRDLDRLTMFADNLVPHVLRLDGVLSFELDLVTRIDRHELIEHGSREEIEIRACAVHAVELIAAARPTTSPAELDHHLWNRGQSPEYKSRPRHRTRCTAY
jgi:hypothetical protein